MSTVVAQAAWALLAVMTMLAAMYIYHREGHAWRAAAAALLVGKAAAVMYMVAGLDVAIASIVITNKKTLAQHTITLTAAKIVLAGNAITLAVMWAAGLLSKERSV